MGSKQSTANSPSRGPGQGGESGGTMTGGTYASSPPFRSTRTTSTTGAGDSTEHLSSSRDNIWRQRARSLTAVLSGDGSRPSGSSALDVLAPFGMSPTSTSDILSVSSTDDPMSASFGFTAHSLPVHFFPINGFKCPFCSKTILPDDVECHLVMCITKPPLNYNEDILVEDKKDEECVICLEEMLKGCTIARLPCLCIYHKQCIDAWFEVNRSCPEHPAD